MLVLALLFLALSLGWFVAAIFKALTADWNAARRYGLYCAGGFVAAAAAALFSLPQ